MPIIDPMTQAIKDFTGGLTHLDANPYVPDTPPFHEWVAAMIILEEKFAALPPEPEVQAA